MEADSTVKKITLYLTLVTLFSILVSLYMKGTTCMCVTEYMDTIVEYMRNGKNNRKSMKEHMENLDDLEENTVRHGETTLEKEYLYLG
jgi:hypothetical protein